MDITLDASALSPGVPDPPSNTGSLDDLAHAINEHHAQAGASMRRGIEHAIRVGALLIEARDRVEHGSWLPWLARYCDVSARQAQAYMQLVRKSNTRSGAHLTGASIKSALGYLPELVGDDPDADDGDVDTEHPEAHEPDDAGDDLDSLEPNRAPVSFAVIPATTPVIAMQTPASPTSAPAVCTVNKSVQLTLILDVDTDAALKYQLAALEHALLTTGITDTIVAAVGYAHDALSSKSKVC